MYKPSKFVMSNVVVSSENAGISAIMVFVGY